MDSDAFHQRFSHCPHLSIGRSTFWILDDHRAAAFIPMETHALEKPGDKPTHSFFSFRDTLSLVSLSDDREKARESLSRFRDRLGQRDIEIAVELNGRFIGCGNGRVSGGICQEFCTGGPAYTCHVDIGLAVPVSTELYLEASGGRCWRADLDNQRRLFFCTDQWILEWFDSPQNHLPSGCYFEHMDGDLSFVVELDDMRCAIVARRSSDSEKEGRGAFGWSSDSSALPSEETEAMLTVPHHKLKSIGELDVPPEAILSRARGRSVLASLLKREDLGASPMFRRCTW